MEMENFAAVLLVNFTSFIRLSSSFFCHSFLMIDSAGCFRMAECREKVDCNWIARGTEYKTCSILC